MELHQLTSRQIVRNALRNHAQNERINNKLHQRYVQILKYPNKKDKKLASSGIQMRLL